MSGHRYSKEQVDRMLALYEAGEKIQAIADEVGTTRVTVRAKLRAAGVLEDRRTRSFTAEQIDAIIARYESGDSLRAIGRDYAVHGEKIADLVRSRGGKIRREGGPRRVTDDQLARMVAAYKAGESCREIGRREGVHFITVGKKLRAAGLEIGAGRRQKREFTDDELALMVEMKKRGASNAAIAREVSAGQVRVGRTLREMRLGGSRTGEFSGRWKGGRVATSEGYVLAWCAPDDPLAAMRNHAGYVLEHRLVMARSLGRALTRQETVHHKNGDRADNRLENLELRAAHGKHQAFRCRACGSTDVEAI